MRKTYYLLILLLVLFFSCKDNPVNPDTPDLQPRLDSLNPKALSINTTIRIFGKNFTNSKTSYDLYLEDFKVDTSRITRWSDSLIDFYINPQDLITKFQGKLFLKLKSYKSNELDYSFVTTPWATMLYPIDAYKGDTITILGHNFGTMTDSSKIILNSSEANTIKPFLWENDQIKFINPIDAPTDDLYIGVEIWIGTYRLSTVGYAYAYNSIAFPKINSLSVNVASFGSNLTINGSNFGIYKDSLKLFLGNQEISSFTLINNTRIDFTIPVNSISGDIKILRRGRASNSINLKIIDNPFITSLVSDIGSPGDIISVNGNYFGDVQSDAQVFFEDKIAEIISFSNNQISVKVPDIINCSEVHVEVQKVKSNEVLFKTPDCISINGDFSYKVISLEEYMNGLYSKGFVDTLKLIQTGTKRYQCSHYFEGMSQPMTVTIYIDNSTLRFNKIYVSDGYQYVDWSPIQATSRIGALTRIYANVSLFSKNNDSLVYNCDLNHGIENSYYENVHWEDYRHGGSGDYVNSGNYSIDLMPAYIIRLKK